MLTLETLADADSFSLVTRSGDVTRCAGVVIDTVGTGALTPEPSCV